MQFLISKLWALPSNARLVRSGELDSFTLICYLFVVAVWKFQVTCFDNIHPLSQHFSELSSLSYLLNLLSFLTLQDQFVLSRYLYICGFPLEYGQITRGFTLGKNCLCLSQLLIIDIGLYIILPHFLNWENWGVDKR